jgi:hypothetical protein
MARQSRLVVHGDASYPDVTDKGVEAISAAFAVRFMASLIARTSLSPTYLAARKPAPELTRLCRHSTGVVCQVARSLTSRYHEDFSVRTFVFFPRT